jgi:hypothetical protein
MSVIGLPDQVVVRVAEVPRGCGVCRTDGQAGRFDEQQDLVAVLEQQMWRFGLDSDAHSGPWPACALLSK